MRAIDLFAGAGGSSTGAHMAGFDVVWAANHWPLAVESHAINYPDAQHLCQDLHQADWTQLPQHDVVMASPCCQGHSKARGKDKPHHDESRATAWAVVSCLEMHRAPYFIVENVKEFADWVLFPAWQSAIEALGYQMQSVIIDAADHGAPQNRERLFIIGNRGTAAINLNVSQFKRPHVPVSSVIDFETGSWSMINKKGRAQATLDRVAAGRKVYGETFLAPFYGSGSGKTGRSIERPVGTLTTKDRWSLIHGDRLRMFTIPEQLAIMGFPADYKLQGTRTNQVHLIGNAVSPPVMRDLCLALEQAA